jgi:hypothetical protein
MSDTTTTTAPKTIETNSRFVPGTVVLSLLVLVLLAVLVIAPPGVS